MDELSKRELANRREFVEDYLVLCSKYGLCIDADEEEWKDVELKIVSNKKWIAPRFHTYMRGLV